MGTLSVELNFNTVITNLGACCLTTEVCRTCSKESCLIGYSKECVTNCIKNNVPYVINGCDNIPKNDAKLYDSESMVIAIADILKQCKGCKENHYDNCILNVLRSCYEIGLFGEIQDYKGSALVYLNSIKDINPDLASKVFQVYSQK